MSVGPEVPEHFVTVLSEHDRKAVWHITSLLKGHFGGRERTECEKRSERFGFGSPEAFAATMIVEKLRDWDAGKPDAW